MSNRACLGSQIFPSNNCSELQITTPEKPSHIFLPQARPDTVTARMNKRPIKPRDALCLMECFGSTFWSHTKSSNLFLPPANQLETPISSKGAQSQHPSFRFLSRRRCGGGGGGGVVSIKGSVLTRVRHAALNSRCEDSSLQDRVYSNPEKRDCREVCHATTIARTVMMKATWRQQDPQRPLSQASKNNANQHFERKRNKERIMKPMTI